ncbi:MAG: hypothetical protein EBR82_66740, partial [Caulobacteraceae bacterium]|nr:hypothetical protein [Caulobacteraceae bacterium]
MSRDRPWMKFYLDDWCDDLALSLCSLAAQGLWMRMLRVMHHADPYGHLLINGEKPSLSDLSRALNVHHKTLITPLNELASRGVYSVDKNGVIFSRRMVRDHRKSLSDKENGRLGGNPRMTRDGAQGVNPPDKPPDKAKSQSTETRDTSTSLRSVDGAPARRPAKRRSV